MVFVATASDMTISFIAERDGDDSSFRVDNIELLPAITEGDTVSLDTTFTDVDESTPYTATVDWGDGSPVSAARAQPRSGSGTSAK